MGFVFRLSGITVTSEALDKAVLHHAAAGDCPNCSASVSGNFCHQCGQETVLHPPSTREFMHEFVGHYVALEGKLWKSLGLLLFRPGRLTLEYIKGRRVRYVQPLRLYLTFSLIFFAVMKYVGHESGHERAPEPDEPAKVTEAQPAKVAKTQPVEIISTEPVAPEDVKNSEVEDRKPKLVNQDRPGEIREGTKGLREAVEKVDPGLAGTVVKKMEHFSDLSSEEQKRLANVALYSYVPYAIFCMMPLFALYLKILYLGSGRRFGEHLLFALHTNGFAFLMLALMLLVPSGWGLVQWALGLWLTFYLPTAMRKVYGGSRKLTALRWMVLMFLHIVTLTAAIVSTMSVGIFH
jgi:hypothetical protein